MGSSDDIASVLQRHAEAFPTKTALRFENQSVSWADFAAAVDVCAQGLMHRAEGRRVALSLPNSLSFVLLACACIRAGREIQVLDPGWPEHLRRYVLEKIKPDLLVTDIAELEAADKVLLSNPLATVGEIANALCKKSPGRPIALPPVDTLSAFYTGFTSGSTGVPKGFTRHQKSWIDSFRGDIDAFGFSPADTFIAPGNFTHSLFMYAVIRGLYAGGTTIIFRSFRPDRCLHSLTEVNGAVVYGVPTHFDAIAAAARCRTFSGVRLLLSSGAKLPDDLKARLGEVFPDAEICEFYGTSEQSYVTVGRDETPPGSVGRAFPGVEIRILDEAGAALTAGEIGRVYVESPLMFMGYAMADNPQLARVGDAFCVGDMGYLDEAGNLFLVGRADRMLIVSGKNIYPEEIEQVIVAHPDVSMVAVFGLQDERRGQRLVAALKVNEAALVKRADLNGWCRDKLQQYKIPTTYVAAEEWPLTPSHKTDYAQLMAQVEAGHLPELP